MNQTYRAAVCTALSGPDSIRIEKIEPKPLQAGEVRIAVKAAGINFPDLLMTYGNYQYRPSTPFVPGLEIAGYVMELAPDVTGLSIGDRVMGGSKGNGFAEQIVLSTSQIRPLPGSLSYPEGACWHSAAITAWHALHDKAGLQAGETVLILGASGGVGMAAVKLARHKGAVVIGTGSSDKKRQAIMEAGAAHSLDPADPELATKVKDLTGGKGADVVFDPVGGELAITATRSISWGGRYLIVGFASGDIPSFPANHALIKGYSLIGLRAGESGRRDPDLARRSEKALRDLAEQGIMRPLISHHFALADAADALRVLEQRTVIGRAVIDVVL